MTTANLIEIFCILDEFCKYFTPELKKHLVDTSGKHRRNRPCRLSDIHQKIDHLIKFWHIYGVF